MASSSDGTDPSFVSSTGNDKLLRVIGPLQALKGFSKNSTPPTTSGNSQVDGSGSCAESGVETDTTPSQRVGSYLKRQRLLKDIGERLKQSVGGSAVSPKPLKLEPVPMVTKKTLGSEPAPEESVKSSELALPNYAPQLDFWHVVCS